MTKNSSKCSGFDPFGSLKCAALTSLNLLNSGQNYVCIKIPLKHWNCVLLKTENHHSIIFSLQNWELPAMGKFYLSSVFFHLQIIVKKAPLWFSETSLVTIKDSYFCLPGLSARQHSHLCGTRAMASTRWRKRSYISCSSALFSHQLSPERSVCQQGIPTS